MPNFREQINAVKALSLLFVSIWPLWLSAQDLSGTWKGSDLDAAQGNPGLVLEIQQQGNRITGMLHWYFDNDQYQHFQISGQYQARDSTLVFTEDQVLSYQIGAYSQNCFGRVVLRYRSSKGRITLSGTWRDKDRRNGARCPDSDLELERVAGPEVLPEKPRDTVQISPADSILNVKNKRIDEVQQVLEFDKDQKDSIQVDLYDNGEIDGDTVSILYNDRLLVSHKMVSNQPIRFFISLNDQLPFNKIQLIAESLGTIPPNTALMIITTRKGRYEVRMTADFHKNAVVEFMVK